MDNLNSNDYKILECIIDKEKNRGLAIGRGSTKKQIAERSGLSLVKVNNTLKILLEEGYIQEGIKKIRAKTFCITQKGIDRLKELKESII